MNDSKMEVIITLAQELGRVKAELSAAKENLRNSQENANFWWNEWQKLDSKTGVK